MFPHHHPWSLFCSLLKVLGHLKATQHNPSPYYSLKTTSTPISSTWVYPPPQSPKPECILHLSLPSLSVSSTSVSQAWNLRVRLYFSFSIITQWCPTLCDPMDCSPPGSSDHGYSPGKNTGVGWHALLQGIFPTQGWNPGLPHCRWILYHLSHQGSPSASSINRFLKTTDPSSQISFNFISSPSYFYCSEFRSPLLLPRCFSTN